MTACRLHSGTACSLPSARPLLYLAVPLTLARDPSMASARHKFVLRLHLMGLVTLTQPTGGL